MTVRSSSSSTVRRSGRTTVRSSSRTGRALGVKFNKPKSLHDLKAGLKVAKLKAGKCDASAIAADVISNIEGEDFGDVVSAASGDAVDRTGCPNRVS